MRLSNWTGFADFRLGKNPRTPRPETVTIRRGRRDERGITGDVGTSLLRRVYTDAQRLENAPSFDNNSLLNSYPKWASGIGTRPKMIESRGRANQKAAEGLDAEVRSVETRLCLGDELLLFLNPRALHALWCVALLLLHSPSFEIRCHLRGGHVPVTSYCSVNARNSLHIHFTQPRILHQRRNQLVFALR